MKSSRPLTRSYCVPIEKKFLSKVDFLRNLWKPFSLSAALKFADKILDDTDASVKNVAIRQAIAKKIIKDSGVSQVLWRETTGIAELEFESSINIPLYSLPPGPQISLDLGFQTNALLSYRFTRPTPEHNWSLLRHVSDDDAPLLPLSVPLALKMPIGHEIELRGQGKVLCQQGIGMSALGFATSLAAAKSVLGEFSLTVLALDGQKKVRVTLAQMDEQSTEFNGQLRAGLMDFIGSTPVNGHGPLKLLLQGAQKTRAQELVKSFASLVLERSGSSIAKQQTICCYDLDLSKPHAQEAYERLLRLSPDVVDITLEKEMGITAVHWKEQEKKTSSITDVQAFSRQLFLHEIADIDCDGVIVSPDGSRAFYCERIYAEKFENIVFGNREVRWEGVEVIDDHNKSQKYYRFFYQQLANMPKQSDVNKFFWLADKLDIKSSGALRSDLIEMNSLEKLTSDLDDTKANLELFFTQNGVAKLQEADARTGFLAFQSANASASMSDPHQVKANNKLEKYYGMKESLLSSWRFGTQLATIIREYEQSFHRNFISDYENFVRAKHFGALVANFCNANKKEHAQNFFAFIGKTGSFEYEEILAALALIAGRENILVHRLSMSGGNITLESIDEGEIRHPRDKAQNLFDRESISRG